MDESIVFVRDESGVGRDIFSYDDCSWSDSLSDKSSDGDGVRGESSATSQKGSKNIELCNETRGGSRGCFKTGCAHLGI